MYTRLLALLLILTAIPASAAVRIKDITTVEGERSNPLFGVGLVVGLRNTGGRSLATQQMAIDMLRKQNITTRIARQQLQDNVFLSTNIAMVMVTANLPAYARKGSRIDLNVSILDDAASLQGGTLLMTPLKGADGQVYAVAQGPVSIGGFLDRNAGQGAHINHASVGRIPGGATVELEELGRFQQNGLVRLLLRDPDSATSRVIARAINERFPHAAMARDPGVVEVQVPKSLKHVASDFVSEVGELLVTPDAPARVVLDERTNTVIVGDHVQIRPVGIMHQNLVIRPAPDPPLDPLGPSAALLGVQPPAPPVGANVPQPTPQRLVPVDGATTVADLARAMNSLGVSTRDMIAIFQSLKEAGALHADLIVK